MTQYQVNCNATYPNLTTVDITVSNIDLSVFETASAQVDVVFQDANGNTLDTFSSRLGGAFWNTDPTFTFQRVLGQFGLHEYGFDGYYSDIVLDSYGS